MFDNTIFDHLQTFILQNIFALVLLLTLLSAALYIIYKLRSTHYGALRYGKIAAADNSDWIRGEIIRSDRYGLAGKPDYIVKTSAGAYIPIEVKSSAWRDRVYPSHKWQVLSYCLLLEDKYGSPPPCAVIQYGGKLVEVPYTDRERRDIIHLIEQIRANPMPQYWMPEPRKCAYCSYAGKCDRRAA